MTVDNQAFKDAMAQWASGVTVLTTVYEDKWKGTTASSFSSVSADPPMVLVCLAKKLYTHQLVSESGIFAVNIMPTDQIEIAKRFAGMYPEIEDRFADLDCMISETGSPILKMAQGWLDCKIRHYYEGGDHTIFVGEVLACGANDGQNPLLYYARQWGQFASLD